MSDIQARVRALLDEAARLNAEADVLFARYEAAQRAADVLENAAFDLEERYVA